MIAAIWIITALLVGLGALCSWGVATLLVMDHRWLVDLEVWLTRQPLGGWIEGWVPELLELIQLSFEAMGVALSWLGAAGPMLVWLVWGASSLGLMLVAGVLTLIVVLVSKATSSPAPAHRPSAAAAQ